MEEALFLIWLKLRSNYRIISLLCSSNRYFLNITIVFSAESYVSETIQSNHYIIHTLFPPFNFKYFLTSNEQMCCAVIICVRIKMIN